MRSKIKVISIHPPRAGRDCDVREAISGVNLFQSTRPVRGGTVIDDHDIARLDISIHPPRAGRDVTSPASTSEASNFNPPAPCGAGRVYRPLLHRRTDFNPPAPCGAGPITRLTAPPPLLISIHPPRAGRDRKSSFSLIIALDFNPPAPCGAGQGFLLVSLKFGKISIHPPRAGRDQGCCGSYPGGEISIHPPRAGRDCNHAQNLFHAFLRNTQSNVQSSYRLHIGECFYGSYVFCFSVTRLFFGANPSVLP